MQVDLLVRHLYICTTLQVHSADRRESAMWSCFQTTRLLHQGQRYDFQAVTANKGSAHAERRSRHRQHVKTAGYAPATCIMKSGNTDSVSFFFDWTMGVF